MLLFEFNDLLFEFSDALLEFHLQEFFVAACIVLKFIQHPLVLILQLLKFTLVLLGQIRLHLLILLSRLSLMSVQGLRCFLKLLAECICRLITTLHR